jgi:hypothetical protein
MTHRRSTRLSWLLALFALMPLRPLHAATPLRDCRLSSADRAWMIRTIDVWERTSTSELKLPGAPLPWMVFFDAGCAWHVRPAQPIPDALKNRHLLRDRPLALANGRALVSRVDHGGTVVLPDGAEVPARLMTFAGTFGEPRRAFLVMAMPSVWRADPRHTDNADLERLVRSVFVHEMSHTRQAATFGSRIDAIVTAHKLGNDVDDDMVQRRFDKVDAFRESYERERDLLFSAAAGHRKEDVVSALAVRKERRERHLSGDLAYLGELESIFLDMEGVANWAGYRASVLDGESDADALRIMRGTKRFWSQEEGLALFLALDAFVPGWQRQVFTEQPASAWDLLASAVR